MNQLKLTVELVPKPLWDLNPRKAMGKSRWDKVRRDVYAKYDDRCGICDADERLEAHEIWDYDDENLVQKLVDFIALCKPCHQVKHFGRSSILADRDLIDLESLVDHFVKINNCSKEELQRHVEEVGDKWEKRSAKQGWECDWGPYQRYVKT